MHFCSFSLGEGPRDVTECKKKWTDIRGSTFTKVTRNSTQTGNEPPEELSKVEQAVYDEYTAHGSYIPDGIPGGIESLVRIGPPPLLHLFPCLCANICHVFVLGPCPQKATLGWCLVLQADEMKVQACNKVMRFSSNNGGGEGSASRKRKQSNSERAESPTKEKPQAKTPKFIPSDSDSDDNSEFAASLFASCSISVSVCL